MTSAEFTYISALVRERSALVLEAGKEYLVEARLAPLAKREGFASLAAMLTRLRGERCSELQHKVVEAMTNNETLFFRDARAFAMLKSTILPEVARANPDGRLTIWCAACSSGQEPYSVAMLLREEGGRVDMRKTRVIASDLSSAALDRARAGRYTQLEVNRGLPAPFLVKYFLQQDGSWELKPDIRGMVEFRQLNLIQKWPVLPRIDIVLMRNVLIYLDVERKKDILRRVARLLAPGGCLVLGGAESTTNLDESFESVSTGGAMYFRLKKIAPYH